MARYFIFGNLWLLVALVLFLGCKFARNDPYMVSFTEYGDCMYPATYNTLIALAVCAAIVCFVLASVTRKLADSVVRHARSFQTTST